VGKAVTRHLNYAWVEYGDPRDGQAFAAGLSKIGWNNAVSGFPVKKDAFGLRAEDTAHPLLPPVKDPLFEAFRKANTPEAFDDEIMKQNDFIANWAFCPGVQRVSDTESNLTVDADITDYVDMVGISGHGAMGTVWGGGRPADLNKALTFPLNPASDRLKYVIIASCHNAADVQVESWMPALRRDNPINGVLGYGDMYPGDETGQALFQNFVDQLKAGSGATNTILQAWRKAHPGGYRKYWAALLHTSSAQNDTMAKWLAGGIETPDKDGEVRWFSEANFPDGQPMIAKALPFAVNFFMGSTKITSQNTGDDKVGLFPGQKGALVIETKAGTFAVDEELTVTFFYYRPAHPDMNLDTLLTFDQPLPDGDLTILKDNNKQDSTTFRDAVKFVVRSAGLSSVTLPYTVRSDAAKNYAVDGPGRHGLFTVQLELSSRMEVLSFYRDGAWLREAATP